jgi:hypothetical protein
MQKVIIPFAGFYESVHDGALDDALRQMFADDTGDCWEPFENLMYKAHDSISWGLVRRAYAEEYAKRFADFVGLESLKFEALSSPREYNFSTDRVFTWVSPIKMAVMLLIINACKNQQTIKPKRVRP